MAEKSKPSSTHRRIFPFKASNRATKKSPSTSRYHSVTQRRPWTPGVRRTPLMALGAIILTIAAIATCIGILAGSDGKPINSWTFQPTVYLAIATTISNICLHFAFAEGVTNTWWTQALRGTTVGALHRTHEFGSNFWAAIFAFRYINFIAVACLIVTISPINGPLMQRASQISTDSLRSAIREIDLPIARGIPAGFTAYISSRSDTVGMLQKDFVPIVSEWNQQSPIQLKNNCQGNCNGQLRGAGFSLNCTQSTLSFSLIPISNEPIDRYPGSQYFGSTVNSSYYGFPLNSGTISVIFKNTTACEGELKIQNCTLQPATVIYPVTIEGGRQSISLQENTTIFDDGVVSIFPEYQPSDGRKRFGGVYKALADQYTSRASMAHDPVRGGIYYSSGFLPNAYAIVPPHSVSPAEDCALSFANPMPDLLQAARDLMFRTAISAASYSVHLNQTSQSLVFDGPNDANLQASMQTITVTQSSSEPRYRSEYAWLAGALIVTLMPTLCVTGLFWGFWKLGRPVSMSPIETAKALGSPLLTSNDGNATGREIARKLNGKQVKYGGVASDAIVEIPTSPTESHQQIPAQGRPLGHEIVDEEKEDATRLRLLMKSPEMVLAPLRGWIFDG